jgi:tetratricopeptide (TPR) repeat protein
MRRRLSCLRPGTFCLILLLVCEGVNGTTVLVRSGSQSGPELTSIQTYAGKAEPIISPVKPASTLTVVLLLDGLSPAALEGVSKDLLTLYGILNGRQLRLVLLRSGAYVQAGPFPNRAKLKSALEKIEPAGESAAHVSAAGFYDAISANAGQWGGNWSRVMLIGDFPVLEAATKDYAEALLLRTFSIQQVQVNWFSPAGGDEGWAPVFGASGGAVVHGDLGEYVRTLTEAAQYFFQVDWTLATPPNGFVVSRTAIPDGYGHALLEVPEIAAPSGAILPTIEQYAAAQAKIAEAGALLNQDPLSEENAERVREDLRAALELNGREPAALLTASAYNEKRKDYAAAARFRGTLVEVRPLEASAYAGLGHVLLLAGEYAKAEEALKRAVELERMTPQIAEDLARVHEAQKDDKGALPYLEEALKGDAKRQDLWFLRAHAAEQAGDAALAMQSFEQGLGLGGVHISECGDLLRLYLVSKQDDKAKELERTTIAGLPAGAEVRAEFAGVLDELQQGGAALTAWKRVLEVNPESDRAHYRVARLLLESGDALGAEKAAEEGLGVAPKFAGLYMVRADALEKQGRMYDARDTLEQGAATVQDAGLLARLAMVEDTYGGAAGESYARLAEALGASSPERLATLERGFAVSVRDANFKQAESFAELLKSAAHPEFLALLRSEERGDSGALVPGGLDALAFAAHGKEGVPPERFFSEFSRAVMNKFCFGVNCTYNKYVELVQEHFQRIAALEAMGKREASRVVLTLSLNGKDERRNTEKILGLLGMKLRNSNGHVELDRGEKKDQAKKQETASALAIDELGIQEALQSGKTYTLEIPYEWAAIYPNEKLWSELYAGNEGPGGFAMALVRMPKMARLYVGITSLDKQTVATLLSSVSLKTLFDKYADEIYLFAAAFALQGGHAVVPGGAKAEAIWMSLVGESPAKPGAFFRALLERDEGRLLAFFFVLSQLDRPHQAFFTTNGSRTSEFLKLFEESDEIRGGFSRFVNETTFTEFFRSVPLDGAGHVDFPGSGEVWTVAKGHSSGESQTAKMMKKVSKAEAPEVEDELLLRMAKTRYKEKVIRHTELENFLAVARIDAHRTKPLDEQSALLLAQSFSEFSTAYPYFTDITELGASDYSQFFTSVERIKSHNVLEANLQLGQVHSLIEWICLLRRRQIIGGEEAAQLFRDVGKRFASAESAGNYTAASLDSVRAILGSCKTAGKAATADEKIHWCLLGSGAQTGSRRGTEFQRVLEMQKVPSLEVLLSIYDTATKRFPNGARDVTAVEKIANDIPAVELPKITKISGKTKESILRYDPAPVHKVVSQLAQKTAKSKANPKDIERLSEELIAELQPQVSLALAGLVYAYFLRPEDLVISEDALLLRKHHYFVFDDESGRKQILPEAVFFADSQGAGSYFVGGFAQFGLASGSAAGRNWKTGGSASGEVIAAQIAAIRGTVWDRLKESDQRLVGLRTMVGREWIEESAGRPEEFEALSEETMGLLSLSRRADLLTGIESRNWRKVWDAVTLPDLFVLGGRYLERYKSDPWSSPATAALRSVAHSNDGSRLSVLGAVTYHSFGCSHPHLLADAPYEEYERHMMPVDIAERMAEFKIFLAIQADSMGLPPAALDKLAEPLAAKAFRNAKMTDYKDWRSLMAGYASITTKDLKQALEQ